MNSSNKQRTSERLKNANSRRQIKELNLQNNANLPIESNSTKKALALEPYTEKPRSQQRKKNLKSPSTKSLAIATKQLASMVRTGLPIVEALNLVAETSDSRQISVAFRDVAIGIGKGKTIVEMMEEHPHVFDEMYLALADAGEQAGLLAEVLEREASLLETLSKLKGQIQSALTYPIAITVLVAVVVVIMLVFVIPIFADMYKDSGSKLPALTQIFIDASNWIKNMNNIITAILFFYGLYWAFCRARKQKSFIKSVDKLLIRIPVVGDLITKSNLANFSRTLASLSTAGVPLLESLVISKRTLSNVVYKEVMEDMYQSIRVGNPIYMTLNQNPNIPKMFSSMFRIGEQTGELGSMVDKLAEFYEEEVSTAVKSLTSILEPLMIVIVAGVVAVILVAMYLPMFNMMNTIK